MMSSLLKHNMYLASAFFSKSVQDMNVKFDMTTKDKTVFGCLQATHAQDFFLAILFDDIGQHMSLVEYRTILKYRLMVSLFLADRVCLVSHKACLDTFEEDTIHCKELLGFKYRYEFVRDVLFGIFQRVRISMKK